MEKRKNNSKTVSVQELINEVIILENEHYSTSTITKKIINQRDNIGDYIEVNDNNANIVFKRDSINAFIEDHMRKDKALEYLNIQRASLNAGIKKYGLKEVVLGRSLVNRFLLISEIEQYKENITSKNKEALSRNTSEAMKKKVSVEGYYNSKEVCELLEITRKPFIKCIEDGTLVADKYGLNNMPLFKIEHIEEIIEMQKQLYNNLIKDYYTASETNDLFGGDLQVKQRRKIEKINIPPLLKGKFPRYNNRIMFKKSDVDRELREIEIFRLKRNSIYDTPIEEFYYQVNSVYNLHFKNEVKNTEKYWYDFVKQKIAKTKRNYSGTKSLVTTLVKSTELLVKNIDKEIYTYTANQLNLKLLNHNVAFTYRAVIYQFLIKLSDNFEENNLRIYNPNKLINPYKTVQKSVFEIEDVVYSYNDFIELIEYCSDTELHTKKAVSDVEQLFDTLSYNNYDSIWLYVIMHLNNGWRHDTIIQELPRIDISRLNISGIEWFKENKLTFEEAQDITYQVGRKVINVEKNNTEGNFFISDKLTIPFATAVCINEIRTQKTNPSSKRLIEFSTEHQRFTERLHNIFFTDFKVRDFKFATRKMNRTYLTFVHKLIESNYESIKASQFARSHTSAETTNIYIKFSREQIDELTTQLFSRDNFGYINKIFTDILFEKSKDKEEETKVMTATNKLLGDKYQVEATSGFINSLLSEQNEVERQIKNMTFEEVLGMYRLLLMNELPAKDKNYQCLYSKDNCKRPELKSCKDCPFSIPNVYAITNLLEKYISQIIRLQSDFDNIPSGQKKKMANHFYLTRQQLKEAEEKFGSEIVYGFIDGGREKIQKLAMNNDNLGEVKKYITVKEQ